MEERRTGCRLCPRECGVNRGEGQLGVCRETEEVRVARAALHYWEEPCISGTEGSGAVFFTGCSLRCIYCQNYAISRGLPGSKPTSVRLNLPGTDTEDNRSETASPKLLGGELQTGSPALPGAGAEAGFPGADANGAEGAPAAISTAHRDYPGTDANGACFGKTVTVPQLADIFLSLQEQGANNINLVTACHFVPQVREALILARGKGLRIPVVYNSSGYEKPEALRLLDGLVDVYLPDFKYLDESLAAQYSKAPDYPAVAAAAVEEMVRQCPQPVFDAHGMMKKGVIVRHLLLPGHVREAKRVASYLHEKYGNQIYISLMNQYTPGPAVLDDPLLGRKVTRREYSRLLDYAVEIGIGQGFFQEGETAAESFIPAFDNTGV